MRKYTFEVVINEGNDEFWESIADEPGCKEVVDMMRGALANHGMLHGENCTVTLKRFDG